MANVRELRFKQLLCEDKNKAIAEMTGFLKEEACSDCNPVYYNTYTADHQCCSGGRNEEHIKTVIDKFVQTCKRS